MTTSDAPALEAGPPPWHGWLLTGAAVAVLVLALPSFDAAGRLLAVAAAVALAGLGVRDLVLAPVLTADLDGLVVVDGLHREPVPWPELEGMRVVVDRRATLLELDLPNGLVVVSGRRLGAHPELILADLEALRAGHPLP